jgi:hypothetical protein
MQIADLLRINEQSKIANAQSERKMDQEDRQLTQQEKYQGADIALRGEVNQRQIDQLAEQIRGNKATESLRGQEIGVAKSRLALDESLKSSQMAAQEAQATNNNAQAKVHLADADRKTKINTITDLFLKNGDASDPMVKAIARDALGLPDNSAQERLKANDLTNAELGIIEKADDPEYFRVYNSKYLNEAPDNSNRFYIYDSEWGDSKARRKTLGNGKTMGDVRRVAKQQGISVEEALNEIYKAQKK